VPELLSDHTTIRLGGPAERFELAETTEQLVDLVRAADATGEPVLVMGGGSNLVIGDVGFSGLTVKVASSGVRIEGSRVTADAGVEWDHIVRATIAAGLAGLESLSGIPGSTGGTPIQNVGAYGTLTSDVLVELTLYDRHTGQLETWGAQQCAFGPHRQSIFKRSERYLILDVTFELAASELSRPIRYADLARHLGVEPGAAAPVREVRAAVLGLRAGRGMLLDDDDHDTWSVGSFFLNPVVATVPPAARECPQFPDVNGTKLSAGWLVDHAGFPRGYGADLGRGTVALSTKHALAITNRGGATTAEVMKFAAHIREGVEAAFGIRLEPECDLVNCAF
jgi:UDP-N-acetylmuramate dehydrogenase